jgi:hypothetical protein
MWKVVGTHVVGTSHVANDTPCQDYCGYQRAVLGSTPAVVIAIADGAGSARYSDLGARSSVDAILSSVPRKLSNILQCNYAFARESFACARDHLGAIAEDNGCALSDLACTSLFAILTEFASFFAQIGDGGWVIEKDRQYSVPIWPNGGEYVNETTFLTSPVWHQAIKTHLAFGGITAVAGFTDGLQRVALRLGAKAVFPPFFDPLFSVLRQSEETTSLIPPLKEFLASKRFAERTDDDKTIVLACFTPPLLIRDAF